MTLPKLPRVTVTLGDPAGIGPELVAKLVSRSDLMQKARVVIIGDRWVWNEAKRLAQVDLDFPEVSSLLDLDRHAAAPVFFPLETVTKPEIVLGTATSGGGRSVLKVLNVCLEAAMRNEIEAVCFAPLNKLAMKMAGMEFDDELHFFAKKLGVRSFITEFNILDRLWTSRITSHIPLREVPSMLTSQRIKEATRILHEALIQAGVAEPRIAVAGLNPHAGEGGTCGREEIDIIAPAIEEMRSEGLNVTGPYPADTIFIKARAGEYDAVVTMYHDQGQIALKLLGFQRGVTVQGGLPVIITTPAHGTAFDIVGQNRADPSALIQAFLVAVEMGARKKPV